MMKPQKYGMIVTLPHYCDVENFRARAEDRAKHALVEKLVEALWVSHKRGQHVFSVEIVQTWENDYEGQRMRLELFIDKMTTGAPFTVVDELPHQELSRWRKLRARLARWVGGW